MNRLKTTGFLLPVMFILIFGAFSADAPGEIGSLQGKSGPSDGRDYTTADRKWLKSPLRINKNLSGAININLRADGPVRAGEDTTLILEVDRPCYVTVLHLGLSGTVTALWPNRDSGWINAVTPGRPVRIPGSGGSFAIRFDGSSPLERIVAVATTEKGAVFSDRDFRMLPGGKLRAFVGNPQALVDELWKRLAHLSPSGGWGTGELQIRFSQTGGLDRREEPVTVTLHIYSGRPDPTWELSGKQASELSEIMRSLQLLKAPTPAVTPPMLGYRGMSIRGLQHHDLKGEAHLYAKTVDLGNGRWMGVKSDLDLELWLLETAGNALDPKTKSYAKGLMINRAMETPSLRVDGEDERQEMMRRRGEFELEILPKSESMNKTRFLLRSPRYEPDKWNEPATRKNNNCYNYGSNRITNTYAQPGAFCGHKLQKMTKKDIRRAVLCDGLLPVQLVWRRRRGVSDQNRRSALVEKRAIVYGHIAAVRIMPEHDYHWYRMDENGFWSHKCGQSPASDCDRQKRKIYDPRTCAFFYPQFGGYYFVPESVEVKSELDNSN